MTLDKMNPPKYTRPEIERRWLVASNALPDLSELERWEVTDHYLKKTRMRLRKMVDPSQKNAAQYKLCKKYGKTSGISEPIVNIYLSEDEYFMFSSLDAYVLVKIKYAYEYRGVSFAINTFSGSRIVTIEAEFESEEEARKCPLPPFVGEDISSNREYESASIARNLTRPRR